MLLVVVFSLGDEHISGNYKKNLHCCCPFDFHFLKAGLNMSEYLRFLSVVLQFNIFFFYFSQFKNFQFGSDLFK